MIEVSFAAAFFGGVLALLSPCSALLLPAFFAYAFQNRTELLARTFLFYLGLATIFVPLGMGATLATSLFLDNRDTMIIVAGVLLIGFGVLELSGRTIGLPFANSGSGVVETKNLFGTYTLGLVYGFGGFCSGPILGSVLTVAAAGDNALRGGGLLAVYALGTVLPLFLIASLWDTTGIGKAKWLRGWGVRIGPLAIHSTNLIAGTVFLLLGLSFIFLDGTRALSSVYTDLGFTELSFQADERIKDITSWIPDGVFIAAVLLALAGGVWYVFRYFGQDQAKPPDDAQPGTASETPQP
ncbi:MAG: cytochrome c biogenesis protein CcdA [Chloroflexi bacterium]|nr:cytochrome c biogenesis protein CcdA [Chloroflexota bacterium]